MKGGLGDTYGGVDGAYVWVLSTHGCRIDDHDRSRCGGSGSGSDRSSRSSALLCLNMVVVGLD